MSFDYVMTQTEADVNTPLIGYHNLVDTTNISVNFEDASYPITNVANPLTYPQAGWRSGEDASDIEIDFVTPVSYGELIDYVGIAGHNFGSGGATISIEGDTGSGFSVIAGPVAPADDKPLMLVFVPDAYTDIKIVITPDGTTEPRAAAIYIGKLMALERSVFVGHTPLPFGRHIKVRNGRSDNGHFTGRIITNKKVSSGFSLNNLTGTWYRSTFDPFVEEVETDPFFWAWRPGTYPLEVGYCWFTSDPIPSNQSPNGMMSVSCEIEGIV